MEWTLAHLIIAFSGAFLAGAINALAGNGSVITLTILTELLGLPGNIANATNRVGVLMNAAGAMTGFQRNKRVNYLLHLRYIIPVVIGAIGGIYVATIVTNEQFLWVFKILMVVMLIVILVKPERWLLKVPEESLLPAWMEWPVMMLLGLYGGFIQMGMGVFYLAVMVLVARLPIIEANSIKAMAIALLTIIAVVIFSLTGKIVWSIGIVMGVAQFFGGWFSAHYASRVPGASRIAYYVLIVAVLLSLLKLFNVF
ncbi:MAG TPA: sulfite exporter TauE/SafE family protein [Saprospiraceae bacterium]|nr:sulfite exporter TauE/SafE family protein [Saprospiraceae bacterium]